MCFFLPNTPNPNTQDNEITKSNNKFHLAEMRLEGLILLSDCRTLIILFSEYHSAAALGGSFSLSIIATMAAM